MNIVFNFKGRKEKVEVEKLESYEDLKKHTTFEERVWITMKHPVIYMVEHQKEVDERMSDRKIMNVILNKGKKPKKQGKNLEQKA